jgi:uncharacterized membrane protein
LIALRKENFSKIGKEVGYVAVVFALLVLAFRVIFYKDTFIVTARTAMAVFWEFVLPGYFLMLYWEEKIGFAERIVIGAALSAAITGIASYYIGILGLNIKYHAILIPFLLITAGLTAKLGIRKKGD